MEAIILAGGLGTRLQGVIGAYPKCMASVAGKPFLHYVLQYLSQQGCNRAILSLGFKSEVITEWLDNQNWDFPVHHVIEREPLGTGGGIQLAMRVAIDDDVIVLNGDTFFNVDLSALTDFHRQKKSLTTLSLKEMHSFNRYGVVNTKANGIITAFEEKRYMDVGRINGGVYLVNKDSLLERELPEKFSFEKDYLEKFVGEGRFYGFGSDGYFIDIGIPEDYARVQEEIKSVI